MNNHWHEAAETIKKNQGKPKSKKPNLHDRLEAIEKMIKEKKDANS